MAFQGLGKVTWDDCAFRKLGCAPAKASGNGSLVQGLRLESLASNTFVDTPVHASVVLGWCQALLE